MDLQVSARPDRACTVVVVRGEMDMESRPMLEDLVGELMDAGARHVVLDFAGVTFMDSSGLSMIVTLLERLHDLGGRLCLAQVREPVRSVLVFSAVDTVLDVFDTVEAAENDMPPVAA